MRKVIDCYYVRFGHMTNVYLTERSVKDTIDYFYKTHLWSNFEVSTTSRSQDVDIFCNLKNSV